MKKLFAGLLFAAVATTAAYAQNGAVFQFKDKDGIYDFGKVKEGATVTHEYEFKNTGNAPLQILRVDASCGCTTPEWPKRPILPGKEASIKVTFTTQGNAGPTYKEISIQSNAVLADKTKARYTLVLKGEVTK